MPAGQRCWDAQGRLVLDLTDRLTRKMGSVTLTAGVDGSLTIPDAGTGAAWFQFAHNSSAGLYTYGPTITIGSDGNTISWAWNVSGALAPKASPLGGTLRYGRR